MVADIEEGTRLCSAYFYGSSRSCREVSSQEGGRVDPEILLGPQTNKKIRNIKDIDRSNVSEDLPVPS